MSKLETNSNIEFPNSAAARVRHSPFEIVSDFELRISDLSL
jgi:hypothetical protein